MVHEENKRKERRVERKSEAKENVKSKEKKTEKQGKGVGEIRAPNFCLNIEISHAAQHPVLAVTKASSECPIAFNKEIEVFSAIAWEAVTTAEKKHEFLNE